MVQWSRNNVVSWNLQDLSRIETSLNNYFSLYFMKAEIHYYLSNRIHVSKFLCHIDIYVSKIIFRFNVKMKLETHINERKIQWAFIHMFLLRWNISMYWDGKNNVRKTHKYTTMLWFFKNKIIQKNPDQRA